MQFQFLYSEELNYLERESIYLYIYSYRKRALSKPLLYIWLALEEAKCIYSINGKDIYSSLEARGKLFWSSTVWE